MPASIAGSSSRRSSCCRDEMSRGIQLDEMVATARLPQFWRFCLSFCPFCREPP
jgi:hypothetical protein